MKNYLPEKNSGLTLLEVCVVISIFFLFLITFYATIEVGLKQWKMGEVQADVQSKAQWVMKRLASEIENTDSTSVQAVYNPSDPNGNTYLSFETALYDGVLQTDPATGDIHWQGYILYFTLPDPKDNDFHTKILYKKFIPHDTTLPITDRTITSLLNNPAASLNKTPPAGPGTFREICTGLTKAKFESNGSLVNIVLEFQQNFRKSKDSRVSFSTGSNVGTDTFILKNAVRTKD